MEDTESFSSSSSLSDEEHITYTQMGDGSVLERLEHLSEDVSVLHYLLQEMLKEVQILTTGLEGCKTSKSNTETET